MTHSARIWTLARTQGSDNLIQHGTRAEKRVPDVTPDPGPGRRSGRGLLDPEPRPEPGSGHRIWIPLRVRVLLCAPRRGHSTIHPSSPLSPPQAILLCPFGVPVDVLL